MNAVKNLLRVAAKIEQKLNKTAQVASAQAGDVEQVLRGAGLWDLSNNVAPLLNTAHVPETASVQINIVVDKALKVNFVVSLTPPHSSALALARLLKNSYGAKMQAALVGSKLNVADTLTLKWMSF